MSMIFKDITDITIPEGDVIKIAETGTGIVLWEKHGYAKGELWLEVKAVTGLGESVYAFNAPVDDSTTYNATALDVSYSEDAVILIQCTLDILVSGGWTGATSHLESVQLLSGNVGVTDKGGSWSHSIIVHPRSKTSYSIKVKIVADKYEPLANNPSGTAEFIIQGKFI